ncbi:hypothetical protein [Cognatiluteimonas weifangensis]|uniref:hypothetical protein n=1 Tax=Cognatiluteimonas weifangensis TaxID=2303539 RepID=UPI001F1673C7|nr:hypothetical protein [Luteimonas weifangensis]
MDRMQALTLPPFRPYANLSGHSGVAAFSLLPGAIAVRFVDGAVHLYDHDCPGPGHVARMQALARAGRGLDRYIRRRVGRRFSARLAPADADATRPQSRARQNTALR